MRKGLGLKTGLNEAHVRDRLKYRPDILELHLTEQDVSDPPRLADWIQTLQEQVPKVVLHHPSSFGGRFLDIISEDDGMLAFYNTSTEFLLRLCQSYGLTLVIHPHYLGTESSDWMDGSKIEAVIRRMEHFQRQGEAFLRWENSTTGIFSSKNPGWIHDIVEPLSLRLCVDVSHLFIAAEGNNDVLLHWMQQSRPFADYYHVVDSQGDRHDGLELAHGRIEWKRVLPYLEGRDLMFEIDLRESGYADCAPMVRSYDYLRSIQP